VHLACEQASNILTKVLEWGRLMSYLEQSTRYISYDARLWSLSLFGPAILSS
jgi:thymidylate synthase ThyX